MHTYKVVLIICLGILFYRLPISNDLPLHAAELNSVDSNEHKTAQTAIEDTDIVNIKKYHRLLLENLDNKIEERPELGDNYFRRAFIFYQLKEYKDALKDCEQAMSCGFDNANLHLLKSEILFAQKNYKEALPEINKTIALNYIDAKIYALASQINCNLKEYAEALQYCSKAIDLDPKNARYYEIRANLDYKVEQYLRCIKDASIAIELDPRSGGAYAIRGRANLAVNDLKQAELDEKKLKS